MCSICFSLFLSHLNVVVLLPLIPFLPHSCYSHGISFIRVSYSRSSRPTWRLDWCRLDCLPYLVFSVFASWSSFSFLSLPQQLGLLPLMDLRCILLLSLMYAVYPRTTTASSAICNANCTTRLGAPRPLRSQVHRRAPSRQRRRPCMSFRRLFTCARYTRPSMAPK